MPLSRLGCPLSLKTANMGNPGLMYAIGLAALIVMALAIACGEPERATPTVTQTPSLAGWTCEDLLSEILEINEKAVAEDPREDKVLNVYDVEETEPV